MPTAVHKIRASECGTARVADAFAPGWRQVTCPKCLEKRVEGVGSAATQKSLVALAPRRVPMTPIHKCVEDCDVQITCFSCNRCDEHCHAKAPNDAAAHKIWTDAWAKTIRAPKKRRR